MTRRKKILFLVPYPIGNAPSQRFRFEQYFELLRSNNINFRTQSFLTSGNWRAFYSSGNWLTKALALAGGLLRRTVGIFDAWSAAFVFIHREAAPIGPPLFEWIIAKVLRKKIIYDFDDAIWLTDKRSESWIGRTIKWRGKVSTITGLSYKVSCGNSYLCDFARQFNNDVVLNPTTIDTTGLHLPVKRHLGAGTQEVVIGWTGSHSTLKYLSSLEAVMQRLEDTFDHVRFIVIADEAPRLALRRLTFLPWKEATEIDDLARFDIGVMPLPDDEWSRGKCGFKILQYMGMCIPSVSSPVGVNSTIVEHGINGFLCRDESEWTDYLTRLIVDPSLRKRLGMAGRDTVVNRYSVSSNASTFLSLFK